LKFPETLKYFPEKKVPIFCVWGPEPDVQQAAQEEDEAAAEAAVFEELEMQGGGESDPDKFTDPWDVSYNVMDDYWYY
jgi:hypothetical protein